MSEQNALVKVTLYFCHSLSKSRINFESFLLVSILTFRIGYLKVKKVAALPITGNRENGFSAKGVIDNNATHLPFITPSSLKMLTSFNPHSNPIGQVLLLLSFINE